MNISTKIRVLRERNHMTVAELAEKINVSKPTISKWENGTINNMRRNNIQALAQALNVTPMFLLNDEQEFDNAPFSTAEDYAAAGIAARTVRTPKMQTRKKTEIDEIIDRLLIYQDENVISPDEQRLLDLYRLLTDKQKEKAIKIIDAIGDD